MTSVMENPPSVEREVKNPVEPITGKEVDMRAFAADIKEKISQGDVYGAAREFAYARQANLEVDGKSKKIRISPKSKSGQELMTVFREGVDKYKKNPRVLAHYLMYLQNTEAFGKKRGKTEETEMDRIIEEHRDTLERYYKSKIKQPLEDRAKNFSSTLVALRSLGVLKAEDIDDIKQCGVQEADAAVRDMNDNPERGAEGKFTQISARIHYILRGLDESAAQDFQNEIEEWDRRRVMDRELDTASERVATASQREAASTVRQGGMVNPRSFVMSMYLQRKMKLNTDEITTDQVQFVRDQVDAAYTDALGGKGKWESFFKTIYPVSRLAEFNAQGLGATGPAPDPEEGSQLLAEELATPPAASAVESGLDAFIADEAKLKAMNDLLNDIATNRPDIYGRYSALTLKDREVGLSAQESAELWGLEGRIRSYDDSVNLGSDLIRNSLHERFIREHQLPDSAQGTEDKNTGSEDVNLRAKEGIERLSQENPDLYNEYVRYLTNVWGKEMSADEFVELFRLESVIRESLDFDINPAVRSVLYEQFRREDNSVDTNVNKGMAHSSVGVESKSDNKALEEASEQEGSEEPVGQDSIRPKATMKEFRESLPEFRHKHPKLFEQYYYANFNNLEDLIHEIEAKFEGLGIPNPDAMQHLTQVDLYMGQILQDEVKEGLEQLANNEEYADLLTLYMDFIETKWKKRDMSQQEEEELEGLEARIAATGLAPSVGKFTRNVAHRVIREAS